MVAKRNTPKNSKKQPKNTSLQSASRIGIGLTTAAVTAAGYYFLFGSEKAEQNRKKVKSWTLRAKAEVLEALEQGKDMTQEEYEALIDSVTSAYSRLKHTTKADLVTFRREMKEHWTGIEKAAKPTTKRSKAATSATKKTKRPARKTTKKTVKKTTKK